MPRSDDERFALAIGALFETLGKELTHGQLTGYRMGLDGIPIDGIEKAVATALKTTKYNAPPPPGVLRELAGEMPTTTRAVLAWGAVKKAVHRVSAYGSVDFDDPVINATIRNMGGWVRLCGSDADEFDTWVRKDFERIYNHLATHGVSGDLGRYLPGIHDEPAPAKKFPTGLPALSQPRRLGAA